MARQAACQKDRMMTNLRAAAARAAALRPNTVGDGGTLETFRAMAGGQPVYENCKYSSGTPDYGEITRWYNEALDSLDRQRQQLPRGGGRPADL